MPDEMAAGHLGRIAITNGYRSIACLLDAVAGTQLVKGNIGKAALNTLACKAAGLEPQIYSNLHSMIPFSKHVWPLKRMRMREYHSAIFRNYLGRATYNQSRICLECADEDLNSHGFSWFRRSHHHLRVPWCPKHGCKLHQVQASDEFSACPHVWRARESLESCFAHWGSLPEAPAIVRRYASAVLAISTMRHPAYSKDLQFIVRRYLFSKSTWQSASSPGYFAELLLSAPPLWLDEFRTHGARPLSDATIAPELRTRFQLPELCEQVAPELEDVFLHPASSNAIYALAIAALPSNADSDINQWLGKRMNPSA